MNSKRISILQMGRICSQTKLEGHFVCHRKPAPFEVGLDTEESYIDVGFRPLEGSSPFSLLCPHVPQKL